MTKLTRLATSMVAVVLIAGVSGVATARSLTIADSDSIFVDGNSFEVVPGKGKGNASALIDELDARDLGPGTIIFRSGNRLYLVDAPTVQGTRLGSDRRDFASDRYGSDRRDYGSDREAGPTTAQGERERQDWQQDRRRYYGSDRDENPSTAQSEREWREWQQSLRQRNNRRDYGSDRRDYGSDRRDYGSDRVVVNDAEYAQYKLKKIFADTWTTGDSK